MKHISILLVFGLLSCSRIAEPLQVTVTDYGIGEEINRTEIDRLEIESTDYTKTYRYIELNLPDSLFNNLIKQDLRTDSTIFYYTEQAKLRGQLTFSFAGNEYQVKRYILDSPDEDDAGAIYFLDGYGIVATKSIDWGNYSFFDMGHGYNQFIIESLKSDTTDFFGRIPRGKNWETSD